MAGALITKLLLNNFANADARELRRAGASAIGSTGRSGSGMLAEFIGTFSLVFAIIGVAVDPRTDRALGPLAIGAALGLGVMVIGPLTGAGFNPARAFGPDARVRRVGRRRQLPARLRRWPRCIGAVAAAVVYFNLFIAPGAKGPEGLEPVGWGRAGGGS